MGSILGSGPKPAAETSAGKGERRVNVKLFGEPGVGKTTLMQAMTQEDFEFAEGKYMPTIGADFRMKKMKNAKDYDVRVLVWDYHLGRERWREVTRSEFRAAHLILLVFDVSDRITLKKIEDVSNKIQKFAPDALMFLIGNKADFRGTSKTDLVTSSEAIGMASKMGVAKYIETSCKTSQGVHEVLDPETMNKLLAMPSTMVNPKIRR